MSRSIDEHHGLSPQLATIRNILEDNDDDDDDIYEPATGDGLEADDPDVEEDEEEEDEEFLDAADGLDGDEDEDDEEDAQIQIEFVEESTENAGGETGTATDGAQARPQRQVVPITVRQLNQLLGRHAAFRTLFGNGQLRFGLGDDNDDEEEEDDDDDWQPYRRRRRRNRKVPPPADRFPKVPSDAGRTLMYSGVFGNKDDHVDLRRKRRRTTSERLFWRRLGLDPRSHSRRQTRHVAQGMVPNTNMPDRVIHYDSRAYSGQFSDDGNFFFSCTQDFKVRMYDTSNPYEWKYYKTVDYPYGQWTITDATLSPDNKYLAYSSIRHTICLAPTDPADTSSPMMLDFMNFARDADLGGGVRGHGFMGRQGFGIWSLRFSGDGREIVAGTSDSSVLVYDLETRKTILKLTKHEDDVNAVCFGDKSSPHILYSGSDDQTLRVWDRRSMADGREAGVFVGHTEGLTYVDSKGDGRYVLSNGKDQMMKLWDLRKMTSPQAFSRMNLQQYTSNFDYRFSAYDEDDYTPNPNDNSVVTFRGHRVLKTLIRCHFSPPTTSNNRYVYTGSEDGKVWIYNLDGTPKSKIDVLAGTKNTRHRTSETMGYWNGTQNTNVWKTCVRDASWSPSAPVIAATSWNGWGMSTGTVTVHSWNDSVEDDECDEPAMGTGYNPRLEYKDELNFNTEARSRASGRGLRSRVVRPARYGGDPTDAGADGDEAADW